MPAAACGVAAHSLSLLYWRSRAVDLQTRGADKGGIDPIKRTSSIKGHGGIRYVVWSGLECMPDAAIVDSLAADA